MLMLELFEIWTFFPARTAWTLWAAWGSALTFASDWSILELKSWTTPFTSRSSRISSPTMACMSMDSVWVAWATRIGVFTSWYLACSPAVSREVFAATFDVFLLFPLEDSRDVHSLRSSDTRVDPGSSMEAIRFDLRKDILRIDFRTSFGTVKFEFSVVAATQWKTFFTCCNSSLA